MADRLRAAVLGCGPAGLLAAHGVARGAQARGEEAEIRIYSQRKRSPLFGCQYLHRSIPGLDLPSQAVDYRLTGSISGYREKVYGIEDVSVSPGLLEENHTAWDIRAAYDQLWNLYGEVIEDYFLSRGSWRLLHSQLQEEGFTVFLNTIPAPVLCEETMFCTFRSEAVWAQGDAPELGRWANTPVELPDGTILCNGKPEMPWYRVSRVFNHHTVEWPGEAAPPRGASRVTKPISTTCTCHPELTHSGRYARWTKGVLAHESYEDGYRAAVAALALAELP